MRARSATALLAAGMLVGCMANGPVTTAQPPQPAGEPRPSPTRPAGEPARHDVPLVLDRTDLRIGMTVQFPRIPTAGEIADLRQVPMLAHVVLALPAWPADYEPLMVLAQLPLEADAIVLLPGYPPSREAAEAWNLLQTRVRIVLLVDGPPPSHSVVSDLNAMRGLERVVAAMDPPSRAGFERLQRPLSFRKVVE